MRDPSSITKSRTLQNICVSEEKPAITDERSVAGEAIGEWKEAGRARAQATIDALPAVTAKSFLPRRGELADGSP